MEILNICPNCCKTELKDGVCPKCSYVRPESTPASHMLPAGTILQDRYFIGKVLGEGGFGITYMGYDSHVNLRVAIKEYYPKAFAGRTLGTLNIYPFTGDNEKYFKKGLDRFMKEAWKIAKFKDEPAVVKVSDSFKENETAYIVMEYVDGDSLKTVLGKLHQIS
jgi:serine/threonine protein kinase